MREIEKLRQRLTNIGRNVTEYRMTVSEAVALSKEFEILEKTIQEKPKVIVQRDSAPIARHLDGGTF